MVFLSKAPVALDTLSLLKHAAANDPTRKAESPKGNGSRWIVILNSPPTVGAVVPELQRAIAAHIKTGLTQPGFHTPPCILLCTCGTSHTSHPQGP